MSWWPLRSSKTAKVSDGARESEKEGEKEEESNSSISSVSF